MSTPCVTLIAAVSADGFISRGKGVPWDIPEDRDHFRQYTAGKWLLLGRRTFEEMHGWFRPDHTPLVLTHDKTLAPPTSIAVENVTDAIALADCGDAEELVVCGGGGAYEAAMPYADTLVITRVPVTLGAGIAFPAISDPAWALEEMRSSSGPIDFEIEIWQRRMRG